MLLRYYHTLRHLKMVQITGRLRNRLHKPKPDLSARPSLRPVAAGWSPHPWRKSALLGPREFCFLNRTRLLEFPKAWNQQDIDKLWLYNLHYFDDLNARGAEARQDWHMALIRRWISENPPAGGNGWEPYSLSLRIVNWIKWTLQGNSLEPEAEQSLAVQARYLTRKLEYHLLGNHLFENAKALIFAGLHFSDNEAKHWLETGLALLEEQLGEQILSDGGHFELSPMYHAIILEGMLDLSNLFRSYGMETPNSWRSAICRMETWLRIMCHPDGDISFFNDAAFGIGPPLNVLQQYAADLGIASEDLSDSSRFLEASGYARLQKSGAVVIADVGAIGPDYLPGHAHADSLSFEFSVHGRRVLVNSGTSVYGTGKERQWQRSTAAHNTLQLDDADSSEVWSGFRVARRAYVHLEHFYADDEPELSASHNGYCRLAGRPMHRRTWTLKANELVVSDAVNGSGIHAACVRFHLHPDLLIEPEAASVFAVSAPDGAFLFRAHVDANLNWAIEEATWHPEFGLSERNLVLAGRHTGALPIRFETRFVWRD